MILLAFAVGQNNFGAGRTRMAELVPEIVRHLPADARWLRFHGHSGNVAVDTSDPGALFEALRAASGREWAVVPAEQVAEALQALGPVQEVGGIRLTPGLAFRVGDGMIVPVVKRDALAGGVLDKARRDGGWGAVSSQVGRTHPGRWTARSWRPVTGLLAGL